MIIKYYFKEQSSNSNFINILGLYNYSPFMLIIIFITFIYKNILNLYSIAINGKIHGIGLRIYADGKEILEEFKDDSRIKIIDNYQ